MGCFLIRSIRFYYSKMLFYYLKGSSQRLAQMRLLRNIVLLAVALSWCIVSYSHRLLSVYIVDEYLRNTLILIPSMIVNVFGLPFLFVCHISLFSKLLKGNIQGQFLQTRIFDILNTKLTKFASTLFPVEEVISVCFYLG